MPFWKMIKEGDDHFEVTKQEPKVDFCEKKYVFDASQARRTRSAIPCSTPPRNARPMRSPKTSPTPCARSSRQDERRCPAARPTRGTPVARMNTGIDGGMNKVFAAKI